MMDDSNTPDNFNNQADNAPTTQDTISQNADDMGVNNRVSVQPEKENKSYETFDLTYEMPGPMGDAVRQNIKEAEQEEMWMQCKKDNELKVNDNRIKKQQELTELWNEYSEFDNKKEQDKGMER